MLQEGDELVILAAAPRSKGDVVKTDLRIDGVVDDNLRERVGSRLWS